MNRIPRLVWTLGNRALVKTGVLLVGTAMMSVPVLVSADSIFPVWPGQEMATAPLGRVLADRGWTVTGGDDGSILVRPQQGGADLMAMPGSRPEMQATVASPMIDVAYWQASLEPHGWGVETDRDGSVLLRPGAAEVRAPAGTAVAATTMPDSMGRMDVAALRERLSPHGWGVERDLDGSVLLIPGAAAVRTAAVVPSVLPLAEVSDRFDLAALRDRLSPHGWGVERDRDGSVLLIPGAV